MTRFVLAAVVALASAVWTSSALAAPQITQVLPESGPTAGGAIITIRGDGFAPAGNSVLLGSRQCPITTESPVQIECTLPEGTGASRPIRVGDGTGQVSPPYPFGYNPPVITNVTASSASTAGGFPITIVGEYFGKSSGNRRVTVNGTASPDCVSDALTPDSKIVCTAPPGVGLDVPVDILVDGQMSPPSSFSYDPPAITAVTPKTGSVVGGTPLTIYGENFSSRYTGDSHICTAARVGGADCPITDRTEDRITCTLPPGTSTPPDVSVTIGCQNSNSIAFSYTQAASKCDAAKFKAVAGYAKCLATAQASGAAKGGDPSADALAKCDAKMTAACTKAETKLTGCTQIGSCDDLTLHTGRGGWSGATCGDIR